MRRAGSHAPNPKCSSTKRQGLLKRVQLPGIRAARYAAEEVTALAKKLIDDSRRGDDAA